MENIPPFESLRVTTMTLVMALDGSVLLNNAFNLLPITQVQLPPTKRTTRKCKLPHFGLPGAILSMRFGSCTRGIVRSNSKTYFKNSITIDIDAGIKNISAKLSPTTIQMCGAVSVDNGRCAAQYIIQHLSEVQDILDMIQDSPEIAKKALDWAVTKSRGGELIRSVVEQKRVGHLILDITKDVVDYGNVPPGDIPSDVDERIAAFFVSFIPDFFYNSDYVAKLNWIMTVKNVINPPVSILYIYNAMVNYNFSLGFPIDRFALHRLINRYDGFVSRYDNVIEHNVTIELVYEPETNPYFAKKNNKVPRHVFLVYRSGLVTLSSSINGSAMADAYYRFRSAIELFKPQIMLKEKK